MTGNLSFETLSTQIGLIDPDIDIATLMDIIGRLKSLKILYINCKQRYGKTCRLWQKQEKGRFNCFKVIKDIIRNKQILISDELVGLNWSISYNRQTVLSLGNSPQLERLVLTDMMPLHDDYMAQVSSFLPNLKH